MVLRPYTGVDTQGEIESQTGVEEEMSQLGIHRRAGAGGHGKVSALASILMNKGNRGGKGMDSLLGLALGLTRRNLRPLGKWVPKTRESRIEYQGMESRGTT